MRTISERSRQFHAEHPICDMLGFNLNHPRFLLDDVDLGLLREDTYRADFPKLARWGIRLTVAKGAVSFLNYDFRDLWSSRPERRPGRDSEPMFLSSALPSPTLLALATLDRLLLQVEENPDKAFYPATESLVCPTMKLIGLEDVLCSLEQMEHVITLGEWVRARARAALDAMLAVRNQGRRTHCGDRVAAVGTS